MRTQHWTGLAMVAILSACGDGGSQDLEDYVAKVRQRKPAPVEPLPEIKQVATYVYEPGDRRDPFIMDVRGEDLVKATPIGTIAPDPLRRKEELEQYALDSLRMVGTLTQSGANWALVRSPEGVVHKVRVGNYMGQNHGQVVRIDGGQIQITEIVNDGGNEWRERQASVALKQ